VLKKKDEQSLAAEDGPGAWPLAMMARKQLFLAQVGLIESVVGAAAARRPNSPSTTM